MSEPQKHPGHGGLIAATAAVTLALGITAASVAGYLRPPDPTTTVAVATGAVPLVGASPAPSVVLVPIVPRGPALEPPPVLVATREAEGDRPAYRGDDDDRDDEDRERGEDREHGEGREHGGGREERDDD